MSITATARKQPSVTLSAGARKLRVQNPRISYEMLDEHGNVLQTKVKHGRPSDINSKHYLDMARKSILKERNVLKPGRPIDPASKRQIQIMASEPSSQPTTSPSPTKFVRISVIGVLN